MSKDKIQSYFDPPLAHTHQKKKKNWQLEWMCLNATEINCEKKIYESLISVLVNTASVLGFLS